MSENDKLAQWLHLRHAREFRPWLQLSPAEQEVWHEEARMVQTAVRLNTKRTARELAEDLLEQLVHDTSFPEQFFQGKRIVLRRSLRDFLAEQDEKVPPGR